MFISEKEHKAAIGAFSNSQERLYYANMYKQFTPMKHPSGGDWLYSHKQVHQAYDNYRQPCYNPVTPARRTIYIQQFGKFNKDFINELCTFCKVFYPTLEVKTLPVLNFENELVGIKNRQNYYGRQYLAQDILAYMEKRVPKDAYCVMGITLKDIYPGPNWNYVYGWAKYKARVGIFSFLRWDDDYASGEKVQIDWNKILYPSIRTMVHEIGHMFGVTHCVYNRCLMNGFNCIQENYKNPLEFCPICYRKIAKNIGFDHAQRHRNLIKYCQESNLPQLQKDKLLYHQLLKNDQQFQGKIPKNPGKKEQTQTKNRYVSVHKHVNKNIRGKSINNTLNRWR